MPWALSGGKTVGRNTPAEAPPGGTGPVTHGDQLTINHVGPWTLQGVAKGSESLDTLTGPGRGYWRFDVPDEFLPTGTYVNDNSPSNHGGVVPVGGMTIDGYAVAAGTRVVQFRDFPNGYDFYAQGTSLKVLFRGCRFRWTAGVSGSGIINDATSTAAQQLMIHYCDVGLTSANPTSGEGLMHFQQNGGANHRFLRNYHTKSQTFLQPNSPGSQVIENWIDEFVYAYGELGPSGSGDYFHLNGCSLEGGLSSLKILRNHIVAPSPDGSTGGGVTAAGQPGYGTQPGQTGYGSGTAPGRIVGQTDCIALFTSNGTQWTQGAAGAVQVKDNLLGGTQFTVYMEGSPSNVEISGNKITTRWWTDGGAGSLRNGANGQIKLDNPFTNGVNGNISFGNVYADDYGTGGNGTTAVADRQYPSGDGPRTGASWL